MEKRIKTRIAYRCAFCGSVISADIQESTLSSTFTLPCIECGKSKLEIIPESDGAIKLVVPCLMCPHPHPYKISRSIMFERDIFTLSCSFTGLDICFIGDEGGVEDEIDRTGAEISALTNDEDGDDSVKKSAEFLVADTSVVREVLFAIGILEEQKKITCSCSPSAVKVLVDYDKVIVVCKNCGKKYEIPARTRFDANNAIDLEEIVIS